MLFYDHPLNRSLAVSLFAMPGINSDFDDGLSSQDLFLSGALGLKWRASENLELGGSAYVTWVFGDLLVLPGVELIYENPILLIELAFPRSNLLYRPNRRLELGLTAAVEGGQYNFGNYRLDGREVNHVEFSTASIGPTANVDLANGVILQLQGSYVFGQTYELFGPNSKALPDGDFSLKDTYLLRAGLTWRVPSP